MAVTRLLYGVYSVTGMYGSIPPGRARRLILEALHAGLAGFDTADIYGRGLGEELLRGVKAGFIATKVGYRLDTPRPVQCFDPDYLLKALRAGLERMGRSSVDLVQLHNPPLEVLLKPETYKALRRIKEEGLATYTGVALGPEIDVLPHAIEALSHDEVDALQFVYNMLEQEPGATIARLARESGVLTLVRVPHAGGVLDESVTEPPRFEGSDHRRLRRKGWYEWALKTYNTRLKPLLEKHPGTPGQKALKFIEQTLNPDYIIIIAITEEKIREYAGYKNIPDIPESVIRGIVRAYMEEAPKSPEAPRTLSM